MTRPRNLFTAVSGMAIGLGALSVACSDPTKPKFDPIAVDEEEICEASKDWLPVTPELPQFLPVPHPAGECPFYRSGWQNFLRAMQPDPNGLPALLGYPTIDQVFHHAKPHPAVRSVLGDIKQAGGRQILIDGNGNSLYYGIHVNQAFANFIHQYGLETAAALQNYPNDPRTQNLIFPPGVVEFKSAWQVVEGTADEQAAMMKDYITMATTVPTLSQDPVTFAIREDRDMPHPVTVRLLAIHVVSTLVGHPEFVWASFEHSTGMANGETDTAATDFQRDVAPILPNDKNPDPVKDPDNSLVTTPPSMADHVLFKGGTPANQANKSKDETELRLVGQKFFLADKTTPAQTSIYRMFPASKSNTIDPDAAITSLNHNVEVMFRDAGNNDKRGNYRLLGAQWMDKPGYFAKNIPIQNDKDSPMIAGPHISQDGQLVPAIPEQTLIDSIKVDGSDSEFSILAGEDRMSSTAMESFTQGPKAFNNCFTCHNTQAVTVNGIPGDKDGQSHKLLNPGLLNVSHILSQFLLEEFEDGSIQ
jgi:hypothetical protein